MSRRFGPALCVLATTRRVDDFRIDGNDISHRVLGGLNNAEVANLLAAVSGAARSSALVDSVHAETAGVPALIAQLGRRLRDLDIANQADRALAHAEAAKRGLSGVRDDVARGVPAWQELHRRSAATSTESFTEGQRSTVCPYKGLASFGVSDADYFADENDWLQNSSPTSPSIAFSPWWASPAVANRPSSPQAYSRH
jgi:hypothetical protein